MKNWSLFLGLIFYSFPVWAQPEAFPEITWFTPKQYNAFTQNWQIASDEHDLIWIANNSGMLRFDGYKFERFPNINRSIVRSFDVGKGDTIWVGSVAEIGFLARNSSGFYQYHRIETSNDSTLLFSDVWKTFAIDDGAIFFSIERYIVYQRGKVHHFSSSPYTMPDRWAERIFHIDAKLGLSEVRTDTLHPINTSYNFLEESLVGFVPASNTQVLLISGSGNVLELAFTEENELKVSKRFNVYSSLSNSVQLYDAVGLPNNEIALATLGNGVFHLDSNGKVIQVIDAQHGLPNDIITNLFYKNGELWTTSDNGIGKLSLGSSVRYWGKEQGLEGRIESILWFQNQLLAGGVAGFYIYDNERQRFKAVPAADEKSIQVWDIETWHDELFVATNKGLYQKKGDLLKPVYSQFYVRSIAGVEDNLLLGLGGAIAVLENKRGKWSSTQLLKDFETDVIKIWVDRDGQVWAKTALNKLYTSKWDKAKKQIQAFTLVSVGMEDQITDALLFGGSLHLVVNDSLYQSIKHSLQLVGPAKKIKRLVEHHEKLYGISNAESVSDRLELSIFQKGQFNLVDPYIIWPEVQLSELSGIGDYIFAAHSEGIHQIKLNQNRLDDSLVIYASEIQSEAYDVHLGLVSTPTKDVISLPYLTNNAKISFEFYSNDYTSSHFGEYEFQLLPINGTDEWIVNKANRTIEFSNLTWNTYTLNVRYRRADGIRSDFVAIPFVVRTPWYASFLGFFLWSFLGLGLISILVTWRSKVITKKEQKKAAYLLEQEKQKAALREAELKAEMIERESQRKTNELEEARKIQQQFLAHAYPKSDYVEFAALQETASEVGGDYYDFFEYKDQIIIAAVGDATGHGVGAGLMVSATKASLLSFENKDLQDISTRLNKILKTVNRYRRLNMALMLAEFIPLDDGRIQLVLCGGGMPPVLILRAKGYIEEIIIEGLPFGVMNRASYEPKSFFLDKNDVLVLFSDGLPERPNAQNQQLGYAEMMKEFEKLHQTYLQNPDSWNAQKILEAILEFSRKRAENTPLDDDMTILSAKIL